MKIKKSISAKHIINYQINKNIKESYIPQAGDVALFEVLDIGKHSSIQDDRGHNAYIFPEDYILCAFGNRYATAQFEGYVPTQFLEEYHILGKGGVVGELESMHEKFDDIGVTTLKLIGYACDENNQVINSKFYQQNIIKEDNTINKKFDIILSVGSSMDSGKTTTAAFLCRGIMNSGKKAAYIKLTGTAYTKDRSFVRDCGAEIALDFSDAGFPSTYLCNLDELLQLYWTLLDRLNEKGIDVVVVELADGVTQRETYELLHNKIFMKSIDGVILSCGDSLSVPTCYNILKKVGKSPLAVSGLLSISPLLVKEVKQLIDVPVLLKEELCTPDILMKYYPKITTIIAE